jgi:hypothetical protein
MEPASAGRNQDGRKTADQPCREDQARGMWSIGWANRDNPKPGASTTA